MDIIKCNCGYYKMMNDELCPECGADYSAGAKYNILDDQGTAHMRWKKLGGEKGFNNYMKSIDAPSLMVCPKCKFKMLTTETNCPKCGVGVRYKMNQNMDLMTKITLATSKVWFWLYAIPVIVIVIFVIVMILYGMLKVIL